MTLETWIATLTSGGLPPELSVALKVGAAHLVATLIPGQSLALICAGVAEGGGRGGLRAAAGLVAAKLVWVAATLPVLPALAWIDPSVLGAVEGVGAAALLTIGALKLLRMGGTWRPRSRGTARRAFAGGMGNPTTCVFFIAVLPALVAPYAVAAPPVPLALAGMAAVVLTAVAGTAFWFAVAMAARGLGAARLHVASALLLMTAGAALAVGALA
jgi:threonine/homoserine/homoserine lactone efflux protein